jgi:hypothetical protein
MKINIDRDMLLTELYDLRSVLAEAALISDEARDGKGRGYKRYQRSSEG